MKQLARQRRPTFTPAALPMLLGLLLIGGILLTLPGCGGCRRTASQNNDEEKEQEKEKKKKEKEKPFEFDYKEDDRRVGMTVMPGDLTNGVKPGHWMALSQPAKANKSNFSGELSSSAVDSSRRPLNLERTPYRIQMSRPVALPKGQLKHLEMTVFLPRQERPDQQGGRRANLLAELREHGTGRSVQDFFEPTNRMPAHQYYLVVLAREPAAYNYLRALDAVTAPVVSDFMPAPLTHYRVVQPPLDKMVPLPSNPLLWTSIAYVVWDDVDPDKLTLDQQDALVDWLHWGGSIIISGPGSLSRLKDSFLANYLPALPGQTQKLTKERFADLNDHLALPPNDADAFRLPTVEDNPPEGVQLKLRGQSEFTPGTGELVARRQVGAGSIVVTSFALSHSQIRDWRSIDGFYNACLLQRPPRTFEGNDLAQAVGVRFVREAIPYVDSTVSTGASRKDYDARLTCGLRYFTRDAGKPEAADVSERLAEDPKFDRGFQSSQASGVGGWNDLSGASDAARDALKDAAGISVPKRGFVLCVLAVYLLVLVPVNWTLFKVVGRVEWAWAAAPLIAIGGAFWVIHAAQLDIGFARSRTEVAVLELQGDHPRGHLTRYMALYTSLSTRYDVNFASKNALAQPFAADPDFQMMTGQTSSTVTYHYDTQASLRGFQVQSNSTSMLHTEEQRGFGGPLLLHEPSPGAMSVENQSDLTLSDVGVVRRLPDRTGKASIQVAWIGALAPLQTAVLQFGPVADERALLPQWEQSPTTSSNPPRGELSLLRLLDLARDPRRLMPGDVKLIGWTDADLGGVELRPSPRQNTLRTLVVANLKYQALPDPIPDFNTRDAVDPKRNREQAQSHTANPESGLAASNRQRLTADR